MTELDQIVTTLSLSMGVAWASGLNLYAALLVLGIGGATGNVALPEDLQVLQDPMVIGAAGLMYAVEFFADKTPGVDTGWDALHTLVRPLAGAILAASSVGEVGLAAEMAAAIMGGGVAGATHSAKAGTRVMINTSPEPVSNWTASFAEDFAVIGGLWAALNHPYWFMAFLIVFLLFLAWALPKLWRGIKAVARKIGSWLGIVDNPVEPVNKIDAHSEGLEKNLRELQRLRDDGLLTEAEHAAAKARLLGEPMTQEPAMQGSGTTAPPAQADTQDRPVLDSQSGKPAT